MHVCFVKIQYIEIRNQNNIKLFSDYFPIAQEMPTGTEE